MYEPAEREPELETLSGLLVVSNGVNQSTFKLVGRSTKLMQLSMRENYTCRVRL